MSRRNRFSIFRGTAVLALSVVLSACGFHLRRAQPLPFTSIYVAVGESSVMGADLKRSIEAQGNTKVLDNPAQAQAILSVVTDRTEKRILSLDSSGRVREYQLVYHFAFRVSDKKGHIIVPADEIVLTRDITFNDAQILAKESEEALLYRDMRNDMVQQIMRRLAAAKPPRNPTD